MTAELTSDIALPTRSREHSKSRRYVEHMLEGRVRLGGVHPVVRWLVVTGLVFIGALMLSMLVGHTLRHGSLVEVRSTAEGSRFVPTQVFPFTMLGFFVAWMLIMTAMTYAHWGVRVFAAAAFLVVNATLSHPVLISLSRATAVVVGPKVVHACYFAVPALLVVHAAMSRAKRVHDLVRPVVIVLLAVALLGIFGGMMWMHAVGTAHGAPATMPELVDGSVMTLNVLAFPLLYIAQLAVTKFAYDRVAVPLAGAHFWERVPATVAKVVVLAFIAVRIWLRVSTGRFAHTADVKHDLGTIAFTLLVAAVVCLLAWSFRRLHAATSEVETEKVVLTVAVAKALPLLVTMVAIGVAEFAAGEWPRSVFSRRMADLGLRPIDKYGPIVLWPLLVLCAVVVYVRGRHATHSAHEAHVAQEGAPSYSGDAHRRQAAFGLALIAVWGTIAALMDFSQSYLMVSKSLLDVLMLVACALAIVVRWGWFDTARTARAAGLVMFAWMWLDPSGANWLSELARGINALIINVGWIIPEVAVVVVGIVLSLLTESAFTNGRSRRFPRSSRVLLWVGYFTLSLVLTNWAYLSGSAEGEAAIVDAAYYLALPFGAWLLMGGRLRQPHHAEGEEGEEVEAPAVDLYVFR